MRLPGMAVNGLSILTDNLYVATDSGVFVVNKYTGNMTSQNILGAADDIDTARIYNPALYWNTRKGIKINKTPFFFFFLFCD